MSSVLRKLSFSVLIAALILGGAELLLRLTGWPDPGLYAGDIGWVWTLRPDLDREQPFPEDDSSFRVRTNALGYRGPQPQAPTLACLGDSTTFGWGVEEDQAWPALLGELLGEEVLNGGVPGHSSFQGRHTLDTALSLAPRRVLLGYLVRDAELSGAPDSAHRPSARPPLQLLRAVSALRPRRAAPQTTGGVPRVSPEEYGDNLQAMAQAVREAGGEPWVLAFPMQEPPAAHLAVIEQLDLPVLAPTLPAHAFFADDPIHLTVEGNALLAELLASSLADGAP